MTHSLDTNKRFLLSYYGDDFTGSTDCLEVLQTNGLDTVLFFGVPTNELLETKFQNMQCIGIAGVSRAMDPSEMCDKLPPILEFMRQLPSDIVHYKVCSTFDSSDEVGSIGLAIDLAHEVFREQGVIPLVVGAPALKRYTIFGNHFASVQGETYRLDRHPTMSRHPTTPMNESDLRLVLRRQTEMAVTNMDVLDLDGDVRTLRNRFSSLIEGDLPIVVLFDVLDDERLTKTGQLIWESVQSGNRFVIGSSGIEYALTGHWKSTQGFPVRQSACHACEPESQILVLSGSCSPVTKGQILYALKAGFCGFKMPSEMFLAQNETLHEMREEVFQNALRALQRGESVILYSALGPDDPSISKVKDWVKSGALENCASDEIIGRELGRLGKRLIAATGVRRVIVAGGDTSGHVVQELNIQAVRMLTPIEPGGPLCQAYSSDPTVEGRQIALKGGQVGSDDYFIRILQGRAYRVNDSYTTSQN